MISAGYIGGGMGDGPPSVVETPKIAGGFGGSEVKLPELTYQQWASMSAAQKESYIQNYNLALKGVAEIPQKAYNLQDKQLDYQMLTNVITGVTNLGNQVFSWLTQIAGFDAQVNMNDRRVAGAENISADANKTERERIKFQKDSDKRLNGPGGLKDREQARQLASNERMYEKKLETQKELAAMQQLEQTYALRSDYNYGNPYYG